MLAAIRRRIDELQLSQEVVEHLAGLPIGYLPKVLGKPPQKRLSPWTVFLLLDTLGLSMTFNENAEKLERMRPRYSKRKVRKPILSLPSNVTFSPDQVRVNGRRGGFARAEKLSPDRRREIARHAIRIRWSMRHGNPHANNVSMT